MTDRSKPTLLIVTEAALEKPDAQPLSDADKARVNGVFRTYQNLAPHLQDFYDVQFLTPFSYGGKERGWLRALFNRNTPFSLPQQPSIRMVLPSARDIAARMKEMAPQHVHVATEGPLGIRALLYCRRNNIPVTTAFHTNWQQYVIEDGFHVPGVPRRMAGKAAQSLLRVFHGSADATMAATPELREELGGWGLDTGRIHIVSRGIDTSTFKPHDGEAPVAGDYVLNVGRLAPGKGVEKFCALDTGGLKKVVVGTGPLAEKLKAQYPDVHFAGFVQGAELTRYYSGAKLFVLPSDTETFGMTVMESLACGTPVVALDRGGHQPIVNAHAGLGVMKGDLQAAFNAAITNPGQFMPRAEIASFMHRTRSWGSEAVNFHGMIQSARKRQP